LDSLDWKQEFAIALYSSNCYFYQPRRGTMQCSADAGTGSVPSVQNRNHPSLDFFGFSKLFKVAQADSKANHKPI
jgi:hypothetical protein